MNKAEDHDASDSDQSDEDFCPEKEVELTGESEGPSEEDEDTDDEADAESPPNSKKVKKTTKRSKKSANESEDEAAPAQATSRRSTRQMENTKDATAKGQWEKEELSSDDEDESRKEVLWASFLGGVAETPTPTPQVTKSTAPTVNTNSTNGNTNSDASTNGNRSKTERRQPAFLLKSSPIANEEKSLEKSVNGHSIEGSKADKPTVSPLRSPAIPVAIKRPAPGGSGGLGSLLSKIGGKKNKLSVLEKSKQDWNSFKQDEGIEEQIQTFNKGKDGYLERQDFLQRTDLRQFEIEKNLRQSRRNH